MNKTILILSLISIILIWKLDNTYANVINTIMVIPFDLNLNIFFV